MRIYIRSCRAYPSTGLTRALIPRRWTHGTRGDRLSVVYTCVRDAVCGDSRIAMRLELGAIIFCHCLVIVDKKG